jgi:hypothetical protein
MSQETIREGSTNLPTERGLRFAVLLDDRRLSSWQIECISLLTVSGTCKLQLLIAFLTPSQRFRKLRRVFRDGLWFAFLATLGRARTNKKMRGNPFSVPWLTIDVKDAKDGPFLASSDRTRVRERRLDFLLYLGSKALPPAALDLASYGVWAFRFGDSARSTGYPPLVWEMLHGESLISVALEQHTQDNVTPRVLRQGIFPVTGHSYTRSLDVAFSGSVDFPLLACQRLLATSPSSFVVTP